MAHNFYKKEAFELISKLYLSSESQNVYRNDKVLQKLPLKLFNNDHKDSDFPFYSRLMVNRSQKRMF